MDENRRNPFTESRVSITTPTSLLTYGDDSFSFFNRLQTSRNRLSQSQIFPSSQKDTQQKILKKYERQIYTMDESGHCLAQSMIDDMVTQDQQKKEDFWQKIKLSKPKKQIQNPFSSNLQNNRQDKQARKKSSYQNPISFRNTDEIKTKRHSARLEIIKIKDIIKKQKEKQEKKQIKPEKFSLVNMLKDKRTKAPSYIIEPFIPSLQIPIIEKIIEKQTIPTSFIFRNSKYVRVPLTQ